MSKKLIKTLIVILFFSSAFFAAFMLVKYSDAINNISNNTFDGRAWLYPENKNIVGSAEEIRVTGKVIQVLNDNNTNLITLQLEAVVNNNVANKYQVELPVHILPKSITKLETVGTLSTNEPIDFDEFVKLANDGIHITDISLIKLSNGNFFIKSIFLYK